MSVGIYTVAASLDPHMTSRDTITGAIARLALQALGDTHIRIMA